MSVGLDPGRIARAAAPAQAESIALGGRAGPGRRGGTRNAHAWLSPALAVLLTSWFVLVASLSFAGGYLAPLLGVAWNTGQGPSGQWLVDGLTELVEAVPGAGPELLVVLTALLAAGMIGLFAATLRRRGWSVSLSLLAVGLVAIHPVTLHLVSTGQPVVLGVAACAILLIFVDRAAALSDAQSLMTLGLSFALLFVAEPNALYLVLPILAAMPWMLADMRDGTSGAALFLILVVPSIVVLATLLAGSMVVGVAPETILRHWLAVLHGSLSDQSLGTTWLSERGGTFFNPLLELAGLCVACSPVVLLIVWRLVASPAGLGRGRQIRAGTAILAIGLAPLSGALAVLFWHPQSRQAAVETALAACCVWLMTVKLRWFEQLVCVGLLAIGVAFAWQTTWLWEDPDMHAWRVALIGS